MSVHTHVYMHAHQENNWEVWGPLKYKKEALNRTGPQYGCWRESVSCFSDNLVDFTACLHYLYWWCSSTHHACTVVLRRQESDRFRFREIDAIHVLFDQWVQCVLQMQRFSDHSFYFSFYLAINLLLVSSTLVSPSRSLPTLKTLMVGQFLMVFHCFVMRV